MFKKLGVKADKLKDLLAQAACHFPPTLFQIAFDQLITSTIIARGNKKPSLTFVGQVILSVSLENSGHIQHSSPFLYCVSDPPGSWPFQILPCSPYSSKPVVPTCEVRRPPEHLVNRFGGLCFHCERTGHWQADCPQTKGVANPNPRSSLPWPWCASRPVTPECHTKPPASSHYQWEHVSQVM
ncbi:hypothetical protein O181_119217 [Austropuccinia psidii MF-1]|uniref:CCHC-type domain-containing protein n=1 Tax=Austropuccinia psidii MF-1 TaxID=1389203 RepID=A0A9Q3Q159_9BASI|nr:hypothetical protein [Austropuccinia psidii MF-1]